CVLRAGEIELRNRGLISGLVVVERLLRQQLPLIEAARAFAAGFRQLQVRFPLTDGRGRYILRRVGLLDLLDDLEVLDLGEPLSHSHAIAQANEDVLEPAR